VDQDPVRVAAAVILRDGRVLLARRPAGTHLPHHWEFPGGKVEAGEGLRDCLRREIREELATSVTVGDAWRVVRHRYPEKQVEIHFFLCRLAGPEPTPIGVSETRWASGEELGSFLFPEADGEIVKDLAAMLARKESGSET
jgi:mutator protein MutT